MVAVGGGGTDERNEARIWRALAVAMAVVNVVAVLAVVRAVNPTFNTIQQPGSQVGTASFIVFADGVNNFVKNGKVGSVDFSSASAFSAIEYAVNQTENAGGGTALIRAGTYSLNGQIFMGHSGKSNVVLSGEGPEATILSFAASLTTDAVVMSGCNNCSVANLKVIRAAGTGSGVEINNAWGSVVRNVNVDGGGTGSGIYIYGSSSPGNRFIEVSENYIQNTGRQGIYLRGYGSNILVTGNRLSNIGFSGIQVDPSIFTTTFADQENITVSNNLVRDFGKATTGTAGIGMLRPGAGVAKYILFSGNVVESTGSEQSNTVGIYSGYVSGFAGLRGLTILGNIVNGESSLYRGILVESPNNLYLWWDLTVQGNYVNSSVIGIDTLFGHGVSVVGNRVSNATNQGVYVGYMRGPSLISSNVVLNSGKGLSSQYGIQIGNYNNESLIVGNIVTDTQASKTQQYGIYDWGSTGGSTIQGNNVTGNSVAGIGNLGTKTLVRWNVGYKTEGSGTLTFAGNTTNTKAHGMAAAPVLVTGSFSVSTCGAWGWTATANMLVITTASACTGTFYWYTQTWNNP